MTVADADADDDDAGFPASAVAATPAAAAPPTANPIHSHLWPRGPTRAVLARASGESERKMEQVVPARVCPLSAVIRISSAPAVRFHCMPQTPARPSAPVVTISVFDPLANVPAGPESGNRKLTEAPSTGLPVSSLTWTVMPRVARAPVA